MFKQHANFMISNDTKFQENILQQRDSFLERNYLESIVDEALGNVGERGGSVVECRTPEREVRGSRPTAAVLCP